MKNKLLLFLTMLPMINFGMEKTGQKTNAAEIKLVRVSNFAEKIVSLLNFCHQGHSICWKDDQGNTKFTGSKEEKDELLYHILGMSHGYGMSEPIITKGSWQELTKLEKVYIELAPLIEQCKNLAFTNNSSRYNIQDHLFKNLRPYTYDQIDKLNTQQSNDISNQQLSQIQTFIQQSVGVLINVMIGCTATICITYFMAAKFCHH